MSLRYPIPDLAEGAAHESQLLIKKSRFITRLAHASSPEAARTFIEAVRAQNADATHNCWAYASGPPGDTAKIGCSDDGEPHGTAGRPMLNVLLHSGIGETACVVTRYFGGIKLGTGGLVRAYQDSVLSCLETLPTKERRDMTRVEIPLDYADLETVKRYLPSVEAAVVEERYLERVTLVVDLPDENGNRLAEGLASCTNGRVRLWD